ncbi:MAG: hypothetical protein U1F43_01820 [Myxococcota bacterium]
MIRTFPAPWLVRAALALSPLAAVLALAGPVRADAPLELAPDFTPHPLLVREVHAKAEIYPDKLGITQCGGGMTSAQPAFTWKLTKVFPELVVSFEDRAGNPLVGTGLVIFFPNGSYLCMESTEAYRTNWPAGTYKLYMLANSIGMETNIRFEIPARSKGDVAASLAAAPALTFASDAPIHPARFALAPRAVAQNQDVVLPCYKKATAVMPLANVEVPRAYQKLKLRAPHGQEDIFLVDEGKTRCFEGQGEALAPGHYTLWAKVNRDAPPKALSLEVEDALEPMRFGAPLATETIATYPEPKVLTGTIRAPEPRPTNDDACHDAVALQPDFHFVTTEPAQKLRLKLLPSGGHQWLRIWGPLDKVKTNSNSQCIGDGQSWDIFDGTYALWVGGDKPGEPFQLALMDDTTHIDTRLMPAEPPQGLGVQDRDVDRFFPFRTRMEHSEARRLDEARFFFEKLPEQLFVFARVDVKADGDSVAIAKGEPLVVLGHANQQTFVLRGDGQERYVADALLGVERTAPGLPAAAYVPEVPDAISSAIDKSGAEDKKAVDAFNELDLKVSGCVGDYLAKHDPTWGTNTEVFRISGSSVVNVGNAVYAQGRAACGASKVDAAEAKLAKLLAASRKARWAAVYAAAKARFGQ